MSAPYDIKSEDDGRTHIPLLEAARRAYAETRGKPAALRAEAMAKEPGEILTWYCYALKSWLTIYGSRPPSHTLEPIDIERPIKDFIIQNGMLLLKERDRKVTYQDISV